MNQIGEENCVTKDIYPFLSKLIVYYQRETVQEPFIYKIMNKRGSNNIYTSKVDTETNPSSHPSPLPMPLLLPI